MAQAAQTEGQTRSFRSAQAFADKRLLKVDADGRVSLSGATDQPIGVSQREAFDQDQLISVRSMKGGFSRVLTASGAIDVGDEVFAAANGKVSDTGTVSVGVALTATTADGDYIEVA